MTNGDTPPSLPTPQAMRQRSLLPNASLLCGIFGVFGLLGCLGQFGLIPAVLGLVLGILALRKIRQSGGAVEGRGTALAGVIVSSTVLVLMVLLALMLIPAQIRLREKAKAIACVSRLKQLTAGVFLFARENGGRLPAAEARCDSLSKYVQRDVFLCPGGDTNLLCHYAFNAKLAGLDLSTLARSTNIVLFFEIDGGWNMSGGPALLLTQARHGRGANLAFTDGHTLRATTNYLLQHTQWDP